jgi:hypothetical protein
MARMAGHIGSILAVRLLGRTWICQMAPESRTASLNWTYRTTRSGRAQTGTPWATSTRPARAPHAARSQVDGDPRNELRGPEVLEAIVAGVELTVIIALFLSGVLTGVIVVVALAVRREDRRYTLAEDAPNLTSKSVRRLTGFGRRGLDAKYFPVDRRAAA